MSAPNPIVPGRFYMITRRCTQREFLLRPDNVITNAFIYCLAVAASLTGVEVILPCVMSNHHHTVVFDRFGRIPEFTEHLHKLLAKCLNCYHRRSENFWASVPCCTTELVETCDVLDKLVYAATNPVKDNLVARVADWPGLNGLSALLAGRSLHARRPPFFFAPDGTMPPTVQLDLVIPPELGSPTLVRDALQSRVQTFETATAAARARTNKPVLGAAAVRAQSPFSRPTSERPRTELRPRLACGDETRRLLAIQALQDFRHTYRIARTHLPAVPTPFPYGTWALRRFSNVPVAAAPPPPPT